MFKIVQFSLLVVAFSTANAAFAHGPQMQITNDNGKIVTRQIFPTSGYTAFTSPGRIYGMPIGVVGSSSDSILSTNWQVKINPAFTNGPGLAYGYSDTPNGHLKFPTPVVAPYNPLTNPNTNPHLVVNILDSLKVWDSGTSSFIDPGTEQVVLWQGQYGSGTEVTATTSDAGPLQSMAYPNLLSTYNSGSHASSEIGLLGDGTSISAAPDDGLYLLKLSISLLDNSGLGVGVTDSDPYFFLLNKNADASWNAAVNSLEATYGISPSAVQYVPVPEPSTWFAMSGLMLGALYWKRKRMLTPHSLPDRS